MLLADLVAASSRVAATSSRNAKVQVIAGVLARAGAGEVHSAVCFLCGEPRDGKTGIGWAALASLEDAHAGTPSLSVLDVERALDELRSTAGVGSARRRSDLLRALFARATQDESDFLRRLLIGDMRQGALEGVVADAVAKAFSVPLAAVRRAAMLSGSLAETASVALRQGSDGLERIGLHLMRPVQPMLASTAPDVEDAIRATGPASVEWKLDGVRVQVHRDGEDVRVWTRNLNEVTQRMPEVVDCVRRFAMTRAVLDGEVILLGPEGRPHPFQETMSRVGRHASSGDAVAFFFDCLHADGEDLLDAPLAARADVLTRIAGEARVPAIVTSDAADARTFLENALAAGHEGVMVKALDSAYHAGRRGKAWRKVKPVRTLDLVVLAAEWGHGRRRGRLSNLHLGARGQDGGFVMVGKTFKGLTDELLSWQTSRFLELERERKGITVFVRPHLVVEIELDGVQVSPRYPGGVALRFARVKRYREDKTPAEADTIETVRAMLTR